MAERDDFLRLLERIRAGDAEAAATLVRRYESDLRLLARVRLGDPKLRRLCDSMDVCQSVLANFFVRASAGQFDLQTPDELLNLLATMIRNKVVDYARRQQSQRRDARRTVTCDLDDLTIAAPEETPSQIVANAELLEQFRQRLSEEERRMFDLRSTGATWDDVAREIGCTVKAARTRWSRTLDRVVREMGIEDVADE